MGGMCNFEKMINHVIILHGENIRKGVFLLESQEEIENRRYTIIDTLFQHFTQNSNSPYQGGLGLAPQIKRRFIKISYTPGSFNN